MKKETRTNGYKRNHVLMAAFLLIASTDAMADQFYLTVAIECNSSVSELNISFHGYWNEAGERAVALSGENVIDPRALVSFTQDTQGKYTVHKKSISKQCILGKSKYEINVAPLMAPRFHPEGFCATRIGAMATVNMNGRALVSKGVDACTETGVVTAGLLIAPSKPISFQNVSAKVFYAD